MKTRFLTILIGLLLLQAGINGAQAVPINGSITFSGGAVLNNTSVSSATQVTSWMTPQVESRDGAFVPFVSLLDPVSIVAPWSFTSGFVDDFWTVGGFSFDLTSSSLIFQSGGFLNASGPGIMSGHGFDPTPGLWRFTAQDPSAGTPAVFSFSASTTAVAQVPDGGSAASMLGLGLLSLGMVRRKFERRA
ncbi:MAG TPA: VPDSG-CTERM sorting domain-containing protein [Verrucomicrobiales bacterium]|jgi:hypothetical protein|nr:VPDSG-CTERM sorting domain-containing protein [Verrucomicrobiales bacterium]